MSDVATFILRVEHTVPDYERWKRDAFDRDPLDRQRGGVRRYRVLRSSTDPNLVAIDLEFESRAAAEAFAAALTELWKTVSDRFGWRRVPDVRMFEFAAAGDH